MLDYRLEYILVVLTIVATNSISEASDKCNNSLTVIGPEIWEGEIQSPKDQNNKPCYNPAAHMFRIEPGSPGTTIRFHLEHVDFEGKDASLQISFIFNGTTVMIENLSQDNDGINDIVTPESYGMELRFYSHNFAARFTRFSVNGEECACPNALHIVKDSVVNISSPNYPSPSYCNNINCYYVIQTQENRALQMTLVDADLGEDTVRIHEHVTIPREQIVVWTGKLDSIYSKQMTSKSRGFIMTFSRVSNTRGRGFLARIQSVNSTCVCPNSVIHLKPGETGTIISPTYPQMYCPNFNCSYHFSTYEGYVIQYEFHDFYIQDCMDKLSILDTSYNDAWELIHFCDEITPDEFFTTSTRQSALKFVAGSENMNARFNITYRAIEYIENCGCPHGQPKSFSMAFIEFSVVKVGCHFVDCIYELKAPRVSVKEINLNLTVKTQYTDGMFHIYEGLPSGNLQLHGSYRHGRATKYSFQIHSNVTIHYHSGPLHPFLRYVRFGFDASVSWPECNCGTTELYAESAARSLLSPNYPESYCNGMVCAWKIIAPEGQDVLIDIKEINLENGVDFLRIICGSNTSTIAAETLTGNHTSERILSCHTIMTLQLIALQGTITNRRFKIQYKILEDNDNIGWLMVEENLQNLMDKEADPCNDFYQYACGKFQVEHKLYHNLKKDLVHSLEQLTENSSSPNVLQQLKKAYRICKMDKTASNETIREVVQWLNETTGGFPLIYQNHTQDWDPYELAGIITVYGYPTFIHIGIMSMWNKPGRKILYFDQGTPLISLAYRQEQSLFSTKIEEKRNQIYSQSLQFASMTGMRAVLNETMLESDIQAALMVDAVLAHAGDKGFRETYAQQYNLYSLDEAKTYWPNIGWDTLLSGFLGEETKANVSNRPICIKNPTYFDALNKFESSFQNTGMRVSLLQNYLASQLLDTYSEEFSESSENPNAAEVQLDLLGLKKEAKCTSRAYVEHIWLPDASNATGEINEIQKYILNSFHKIISHTSWMTEESKQRAHYKLDKLKSIIAYQDWIMDDKILDEMHPVELLDIKDNDTLTDVLGKLWDWRAWRIGHILLEEKDWPLYDDFPTTIGAWHDSEDNSIFISASTISAHMFNTRFPAAVNFGALGFYLAHEVGHALNVMEFDERGMLNKWTDTKTMSQFQPHKECLISQYNKSCYPIYNNICVNGLFTLAENLADQVALVATYEAYKAYINDHGMEERLKGEWANLSMEQVYFVAMAHNWCEEDGDPTKTILTDEHAPDKWRVINTLRNFPTFAKEFKCKTGAAMAPERYCRAWEMKTEDTSTREKANKSAELNKSHCFVLLCIIIASILRNCRWQEQF